MRTLRVTHEDVRTLGEEVALVAADRVVDGVVEPAEISDG